MEQPTEVHDAGVVMIHKLPGDDEPGKSHVARWPDGHPLWPFEECCNPICIRLRDLIEQLKSL